MERTQSDSPIKSHKQDILGRLPFAENIANLAINSFNDSSLVVAIDGKWGDGKTSIKNLAINEIYKIKPKDVAVVDFNPWIFTSQGKIAQEFYYQIFKGFNVKKGIFDEVRYCLNNYYAMLYGEIHEVTSLSFKYLKILSFFVLVIYFVLNLYIPNALPSVGVFFFYLYLFIFGSNTISFIMKKYYTIKQTKLETYGDVNYLKSKLNSMLVRKKKKVVFFIDDIDRLTMEEVNLLFQLIKTQADFKNIVYVLLMDQDIIEEYLDKNYKNGKKFLEKIVQIQLKLPMIEKTKLITYFTRELDNIFINRSKLLINNDRLMANYYEFIFPTLTNIREVKRLLNSIGETVRSMSNEIKTSINIVDLIALECLFVQSRHFYYLVRDNKIFFTKNYKKDSVAQLDQNGKSIIAKIKESNLIVQKIITNLFPNVEPLVENFATDFDTSSLLTIKEKRICHKNIFDFYFMAIQPEMETSHNDILDVISSLDDIDDCINKLRNNIMSNKLQSFAEKFMAYLDNTIPSERKVFFSSAACLAEHINPGLSFESTDYDTLHYICREVLRLEGDIFNKILFFRDILESSSATILPLHILSLLERDVSKNNEDKLFCYDIKKLIKQLLVKFINNIYMNKYNYFGNFNVVRLLYYIKKYLPLIDIKMLTSGLINSCSDSIGLLRSFVNVRTSSIGGHEIVRKESMSKKALTDLLDLALFNDMLKRDETKSQQDKYIVDLFLNALIVDDEM